MFFAQFRSRHFKQCILGLGFSLILAACGTRDSGSPASAPQPLTGFAKLEQEVQDGLNSLRTQPGQHLNPLQNVRNAFEGLIYTSPKGVRFQTQEGAPAVDEALEVLRGVAPHTAYSSQPLLEKSARDHQIHQENSGELGHYWPDGTGPSDRLERYATYQMLGENIVYGAFDTGLEMVYGLFVDDGVPDRGHRQNMLETGFTEVGVACGPHPKFTKMCVINYGTKVVSR